MPKTIVRYSGAPVVDRDALAKAVLDLLMRGTRIHEIRFPAEKIHAAGRIGIAISDDGTKYVYDGHHEVVTHPNPYTIVIKHD